MDPVAVRGADHDHLFERRALAAHRLDLRDMVGGDDGEARAALVDAVFDVLGLQQVGARHGDYAELDAADHGLVPGRDARDHHEGEIALGRAEAAQHVGEAVGRRREVGKAPDRLLAGVGVGVDEGGLVPFGGAAVDQIEAEIVEFRRRQADAFGQRGRVIGQVDIAGHGGSGGIGRTGGNLVARRRPGVKPRSQAAMAPGRHDPASRGFPNPPLHARSASRPASLDAPPGRPYLPPRRDGAESKAPRGRRPGQQPPAPPPMGAHSSVGRATDF